MGSGEASDVLDSVSEGAPCLMMLGLSQWPPLAPPCLDGQVEWTTTPTDGRLRGVIFNDGSGMYTEREITSRAGWGLAALDGRGRIVAAAHGPLPLFTQSVGCAEVFTAATAIRLNDVGPIVLVSDYQRLLDGWELGDGAFTDARAMCGEAWRLFWFAARDFGLDNITVRKVKAHLSYRDVQEGRVDFIDWMGNQAADAEARKGVLLHPDNGQLVEQANQLRADQAALCQYFAHMNERIQRQTLSEHLYAAHSPAVEALLASRGPPLRAGGPLQEGAGDTSGFVASSDPRSPCARLKTGAGEGDAASSGLVRVLAPLGSEQIVERCMAVLSWWSDLSG